MTSAYVWIDYDTNNITSATLYYETNGVWQTLTDGQFPFEFTVPMPDNRTSFRFYVKGTTPAGTVVSNSAVQLGYQLTIQSTLGPTSNSTSALYNYNQSITTSVTSPIVTNGTRYVCTGWNLAGNSPVTGAGTSFTLSLTNDAILTWNWQTIPLAVVDNGVGATAITATNAWLNCTLNSTGRAPTTVSFYWGSTDGGTTRAAWANKNSLGLLSLGSFSNLVSSLVPNANYFYRTYATNSDGEVWATNSISFTTPATNGIVGAPTNAGWMAKIIVANYYRSETLTNFPALVVLGTNLVVNGFSYSQFLSAGGYDLRFKDAAQSQFLNYEISQWNTNGKSYVWVQVPQFTSNTWIWAYWGNPSYSSQYPSLGNGATWSNGYTAVWHFQENPANGASIYDSTANGNLGIASNMVAGDQISGISGGSLNFDGATKYIGLNSELVLPTNSAFTLSAWARPSGNVAFPGITAQLASPGFNNSLRLFSDSKPRFNVGGSGKLFNTVTPKDGVAWSYLAATRASGSPGVYTHYQDGTNDTGSATSSANTFSIAYLGRGMETNDLTRNWLGGLAEIRVSSIERSSNWIWAEWMSQASNQVLTAYSSVQTNAPFPLQASPVAGKLVISWPGALLWNYDVEFTTNLATGFSVLVSNLPGVFPVISYTNNLSSAPQMFFRVKAK